MIPEITRVSIKGLITVNSVIINAREGGKKSANHIIGQVQITQLTSKVTVKEN